MRLEWNERVRRSLFLLSNDWERERRKNVPTNRYVEGMTMVVFSVEKSLASETQDSEGEPSLNSGHQGTAIRIMPTKGQRSGNERLYESWVSPSVEVCSLIMRYVMSMEMVRMNMDFQDRNDKQTTLYFTFTRKAQCLKVIFTIVITLECYFYALPVNLSTENRIYRFFTIFCWMFSHTYSLWLESKICRDIAMIVS